MSSFTFQPSTTQIPDEPLFFSHRAAWHDFQQAFRDFITVVANSRFTGHISGDISVRRISKTRWRTRSAGCSSPISAYHDDCHPHFCVFHAPGLHSVRYYRHLLPRGIAAFLEETWLTL